MPTTTIATETARPSLKQDLESIYSSMRCGGAFDVKKDLVLDGTHNEKVSSLQSRTHTPAGFKTQMTEQSTEMYMAKDNKVVTTRLRTSIYGDHSNQCYKP